MHATYLDAIKSFEGYTPRAKWDYAQNSNGYGTKALYAGETIDRAEADRRFTAEIDQARSFVERHAKGWDEGTKAALTSLTFNAGTRWTSGALGQAVRNFDAAAVEKTFVTYTKAGGQVLPGLVERRLAEVAWMGQVAHPPAAPPVEISAMRAPIAGAMPARSEAPLQIERTAAVAAPVEPVRGNRSAAIDRAIEANDFAIPIERSPRDLDAATRAMLVLDFPVRPRDEFESLVARRTRRSRPLV